MLLRLAADGRILEKQLGAMASETAGYAGYFGGHLAEIPDQSVAKQYTDALARVVHGRTTAVLEHPVCAPYGDAYLEARLLPLGEGECLAIVRNISEHKRSEAEQRHTVSVLQSTLEASADGILVVDYSGRITAFNRRFADQWGLSPELLAARSESAVLAACAGKVANPQVFLERVVDICTHTADDSVDVIECSDGRVFERVSRPQYLDGVAVGRVWTFHDISARRRTEDRIIKLSRVVEQTADSVLITDAKGNIEYINPAFTVLTGYEPADVLGGNPRLLKSGRHDLAFYQEMWDTILAGQIFHAVLVNRKKNGELYHADTTITPIKDAVGTITHFVSTEQDITSHRELEAQLRQAQKMEAVGQLAAGVAHDFNNLLTVILGNVGIMQLDESAPAPMAEALGEVADAAERAANLTRQLLTFSRRRPLQTADIDLNDLLSSMAKMLSRVIGEHIVLETHFAPGGAPVHADHGMMEQVLMNLAVNARDAMPAGGRLVLETRRVNVTTAPVGGPKAARPGKFICLEVSDTGYGIPADHMVRIFEPFFTTKDVGKGTGLGLAAVLSIVEQHSGWIEVESKVDVGTRFRLFLPRLPQGSERHMQSDRARPGPRGDETVLLVEDESAVRKFMESLLVGHGYRVYSASTGAAAIEMWRQHALEIDLLVTDMILAGHINGAELASRLKAQRNGLRVLYCSGYSDEMLGANSPLRQGANFVDKPFKPEKFLRIVRQCLDTPA
jgi:PAS domain S-box-containing protein